MLQSMCSLSLAALACSGATAPSTPSVASWPREMNLFSDYDSNTPFLTNVPTKMIDPHIYNDTISTSGEGEGGVVVKKDHKIRLQPPHLHLQDALAHCWQGPYTDVMLHT